MKRTIIIALLALVCAGAYAQTTAVADTVLYKASAQVDSTLLGSNIFANLPDGVKVHQSPAIRSAMFSHVERNASKQFTGFRIRIYNESVQNARSISASEEERFKTIYPYLATYRTYSAPFFKVTVGDFRTRVEAEKAIRTIRNDFPDAVIVKERFKYPSLDGGSMFKADTVWHR